MAGFEAALYTIYSLQKSEVFHTRCPRAKIITQQVQQELENKVQLITNEIKILEQEDNNSLASSQEIEQLLNTEFNDSVTALRNWLTLSNLKTSYHFDALLSLQKSKFHIWKQNSFKPDLLIYQKALQKLIENISKGLNKNIPKKLYITFPRYPTVELPSSRAKSFGQNFRNIFTRKSNKRKSALEYNDDLWRAYEKAVNNYFTKFSKEALKALAEYEKEVQPLITLPKPPKSPEIVTKDRELKLLNDCLENLRKSNKLLKSKNSSNPGFKQQKFSRFPIFIKYFILTLFWSK